jgi:hypothetical protein
MHSISEASPGRLAPVPLHCVCCAAAEFCTVEVLIHRIKAVTFTTSEERSTGKRQALDFQMTAAPSTLYQYRTACFVLPSL